MLWSIFLVMPKDQRDRLFLIDGYALIYRAFFAMISRPLRTGRGENTSAVWGVANFLHRLHEEYRPDYVVWVHDSGSSFRDDIYPEYKATREKLDDELRQDFDRSLERVAALLSAWAIPLVAVDGYEADDVIGSLAAKAGAVGLEAVIVSGDKDFYQLVGPLVKLLNPGRGGPAGVDEQWVDVTNAHERLGVPPERVVDYLALVGDSSDNVPGVRGVGDKTARKLIAEFGNLDSVLAHAKEVSGKRAREALLADGANARLSRDLVTIRRDVPVELALETLMPPAIDRQALATLYGELEFHSLIDRLEPERKQNAGAAPARLITNEPGEAQVLMDALQETTRLMVDAVVDGEDPVRGEMVGLALGIADVVWYLPIGHRLPDGELISEHPPENIASLADGPMRVLRERLENASVKVIGHDLKRSVLALRTLGMELDGLEHDTMLASFVLDPSRRAYSLDVLAREHLGLELPRADALVGKGRAARTFAELTPEQVTEWIAPRAHAVDALRQEFDPALDARAGRTLFDEVEMPLVRVLADLQWAGISVDLERLSVLSDQFQRELDELQRSIFDEAGAPFNINSTPQLRHILFEKLQLPVIKRTKTGASTDAEVLAELAGMGHRLPTLLLEYRELSKLQSTYVDRLPRWVDQQTGRIHTQFSQTGAATGRLSSSDPNLQNIPIRTSRGEEIRRCFRAAPGSQLVVADYSQIELRLLAHLSQDEAFLEAFHRGSDIHRETAAIIFDVPVDGVTSEMRGRAKTINFATIYGQGAFSLAKQLDISQDDAQEFIKLYFERFAGVRRYLDECVKAAKELGYAETIFGRRRYIPELRDRNYNMRAFGERVAMNSPLQGSAADLIKRAMVGIWEEFSESQRSSRMLLQVHDELVIEAPLSEVEEASAVVRKEMEAAAELSVPLVVDIGIGSNWFDAKA